MKATTRSGSGRGRFHTACVISLLADGDIDADGLIDGTPIQICKSGHFPPRDLDITDEMLKSFVANADPGVFGRQIHFDYDHGSESESNNPSETGKAAGWLQSLFVEEGLLWAIPRWTKAAYDAITAGEWRYISVAFARNYTKNDGTELGPALTSIALTNHPFLRGLAPITASERVIDMTKPKARPRTVTLSAEKYSELEANAQAGAAAAKELRARRRDAAIGKLLQERKITLAQKRHAAKLYDRDLEMFQEWAATLTPIAALSDRAIGDDVDEPDEDSASAQFSRLVKEKVDKSDGKMDYRTAYMAVQREKPELARQLLREHRQ